MTRVAKRALDLLVGGLGSAIAAPLIAVAMLAIRLESPGHPIYRQTRVGRDGVPFEIYKLRTMVSGAEFTGAGLAIQEGEHVEIAITLGGLRPEFASHLADGLHA